MTRFNRTYSTERDLPFPDIVWRVFRVTMRVEQSGLSRYVSPALKFSLPGG
jgi:hypothetical protein